MTATTAKPHYHVHVGHIGYLPDRTITATTKREAQRLAIDEARFDRTSGYRVRGSAARGYYDTYALTDGEYLWSIDIEKCNKPRCLTDECDY